MNLPLDFGSWFRFQIKLSRAQHNFWVRYSGGNVSHECGMFHRSVSILQKEFVTSSSWVTKSRVALTHRLFSGFESGRSSAGQTVLDRRRTQGEPAGECQGVAALGGGLYHLNSQPTFHIYVLTHLFWREVWKGAKKVRLGGTTSSIHIVAI